MNQGDECYLVKTESGKVQYLHRNPVCPRHGRDQWVIGPFLKEPVEGWPQRLNRTRNYQETESLKSYLRWLECRDVVGNPKTFEEHLFVAVVKGRYRQSSKVVKFISTSMKRRGKRSL